MTSIQIARAHFAKAQEFLDAAEMLLDLDMLNVAISSAALSGINSKDAICLRLTGRTDKTERHSDAAKELTQAGADAAALAPALKRLIAAKNKAQYRSTSATPSDARNAVRQAKRMYEGAQVIVTS